MKKILLTTIFSSLGFLATPNANAAAFIGAVANPFVFCSLPKPCKLCSPWRNFWEQICPAGKTTPQEQQQVNKSLQEVAKTNPELLKNLMTEQKFKKELTPAMLSAFTEETNYEIEINSWIKYSGNSYVNGKNGKKLYQVWCEKNITNPLTNPTLRKAANDQIVSQNKTIVDTIARKGELPPKTVKPWFNYNSELPSCQNK